MLLFALDLFLSRTQKALWKIYWVCVKRKSMNEESLSNLLKICRRQLMSKAIFAMDKMVIELKNDSKDM